MTSTQFASLLALSTIAVQAFAQVQPWPGDQPAIPQPVVQQTGNPVVYQMPRPPSSSDVNGGAKAHQMIQQVMSAFGGNREIASGGDGYEEASLGNQNGIDFKGSAGSDGGEAQKIVEGCSSDRTKVRFVYNEGKDPTPKCDSSLQMAEVLADTIDTHFIRCVKQAGAATGQNLGGTLEDVKIYNKGVKGDENHSSRSYHARSMAIDVSAIQVGGSFFSVADSSNKPFFTAFRGCWATAVNSLRGNCLTNTHPGSVGDEDGDHRGSHLHISVPYCDARSKNMYIAQFIQWFFGEVAHAAEKLVPGRDTPPAVTYKGKTVVLKDGSAVKLVVADLKGEPVGGDQRMTLSLKCKADKEFRRLDDYVEGCRYNALDIDEAGGFATIRYTVSQMTDKGVLECAVPKTKILSISCK